MLTFKILVAVVLVLLAVFLWAVLTIGSLEDDQQDAREAGDDSLLGMVTIGGGRIEELAHPLQGCDVSPDGFCDFPGERDDDGEPCSYCRKQYTAHLITLAPCG